jgi:3-hydroxyisobutyrate dehydrogenase-like beta-hydroxyacid dehydrogenase
MSDQLKAGFIGLGDQGAPIARRMIDAGFALTIWGRRAETTAAFAQTSAKIAPTPAMLAAQCDVIGICVVNDDDVRQVAVDSGLIAAMRPGSVLAIHSTLLPETVIHLDQIARSRGVHLLDAPVSGGPNGATAGTMTVMVGGTVEALELARPVFASFARLIAHLGPVGSGQIIKLLNNNLAYANVVASIDALDLAEKLGIDRDVAIEVIRMSSGNSGGFGIVADPRTFRKISGPGSNLAKDVHHLGEVADSRGFGDAPLLAVSRSAQARIAALAKKTGFS